MPVPNDAEVVERSLVEPARFVDLYDRHARATHRYVARRAGTQVADELQGEIWLQAFRARVRFAPTTTDARPWLYGIARNVLRAQWRAGRRRHGPPREEHFDPWADVDDRLEASRGARTVASALEDLAVEDREVLLLVAWEGLTPAEAASCLGIPDGTARWRLHRARRQLRETLGAPPERATTTGTAKEDGRWMS